MTLPPDCKQWAEVLEAEVLGEPLAEDARRRAVEHEAQCSDCKAERRAWVALATPPSERPDEAFVDGVLDSFDRAKVVRPRRFWAGAATVAACAAAVVGFWLHGRGAVQVAPGEPLTSSASLAEVRGDVWLDGVPAHAASPLRASQTLKTGDGRACIVVDPGVRACLDRDAEMRVEDLTLATRRLDLRRGRIVASLEPQPEDTSFTVSTASGSVTAIGTAFIVDTRGGTTVARVLHGVVRVHGRSGDERLGAHERLDLVTGARSRSDGSEERDDQALLEGAPVPPLVPTAEESATSTSQPVHEPVQGPAQAAPSAAELLRTARGLRGQRKLAEAAQAYRRLEALYPDSAECHASYVSLGELELGGLADPEGALRSYDAYLAAPGPSTREARYGRIRALHLLRRTDEEKRAITTFVADYPSSDEAAELRDGHK